MSTTTIRIEDELKERVAVAAENAGKTAHAFILDAIAQTVERAEQDIAFQHLAEQRWAQVLATRQTVAWDDAKDYLNARARGQQPGRPVARKTVG